MRVHREQAAFEREVPAASGDGFQIRSSYFTMAPHRVRFDRMATARTTRSYDCCAIRATSIGSGSSPATGPRWVRGAYFDPRGP